MATLSRGDKKLLNAWAAYDWANSVYSLTIVSTIFPIFYALLFDKAGTKEVELFGMLFKHTSVITFITALAFLVIVVLSPILSGIADYLGNKKAFMRFFCYLGSAACVGLYWFSLEHIYFSLLCYFCGVVGFWGSIVFYNSYLPDIALPEQYDRVSARGFSMGYAGSVLLLLLNLALVMKPELIGLDEGTESALLTMRISFLTVGIWWFGFSQIPFYYLPNNRHKDRQASLRLLSKGYKELHKVWLSLKASPRLKGFLFAFFVYSMGVQTVLLVATYFGTEEIAWENEQQRTTGLIISVLVIQLVAILGASATVWVVRRMGNIATLIALNAVWIAICIVAYHIQSPTAFYVLAGFVGLVMGGIQTLSRSTYSAYLPATEDTTSFFSFYDVTEKLGIVIGMGIYGLIDQFTSNMRNATVSLVVFFSLGIILLWRLMRRNKP